jgi:uncharacterized repeat protein (TIGR03943 family)
MTSFAERPHLLRDKAARTAWSPARMLDIFVLGSWAALFWYLLFSGRTSLYLSSRTSWVVPVGALILSFSVLGRVASLRSSAPESITRARALGAGVLVLPVVAVLALPPASLGAYAATRRSSIAGAGFAPTSVDVSSGQVTLPDVAAALRSRADMRTLQKVAGTDVSFTGFVTRAPGAPADEFLLTRFLISCCVADALSIQVRVVGAPPTGLDNDQWVRVEGQLYPLGREVLVDADDVVKVPKPDDPYISP